MRKTTILSNILCAVMIAVYSIFLMMSWPKIPDTVPSHFDAFGNPDSYGGKWVLVLEPVLSLLLWGLIAIVRKFPNVWNFPVKVTEKNRERLYEIGNRMMDLLMPMVVFLMIYIGAAGICPLPVLLIYLVLAAMAGDIVVSMIQMIKAK
ncbi:MAG: DUF1648 domain-containing protein [Eubacterium sp.]|nr:DUF1648 domain-containing protein [Eubacterium sp.]